MGVMPCTREGCENILCDNYNVEFGYLCNDCKEELIAYLACRPLELTEDAVNKFLETPKSKGYDLKELAKGFVEGIFTTY